MTSTYARFAPLLRRLGFRKTYSSTAGGQGMREWKREEPDGRTLVVQLWGSGQHRISHDWVGCSDTRPTSFADEGGMVEAIEIERARADSKYGDPLAHHYLPARKFLQERQQVSG